MECVCTENSQIAICGWGLESDTVVLEQYSSAYSCTIKMQCAFEPLLTPLALFSTNQRVITFSLGPSGHDSEVFFLVPSSQYYTCK